MSLILWVAKTISPDFFKLAKTTNEAQILTISFSHYCEIACWAFRLAKIPYKEHSYAPGQHVLPVLSVRVGNKDKKYLSSSSRVSSVKEQDRLAKATNETDEERKKREKVDKSKRSTAVPLAILPDGNVLLDSWDCARKAGFTDIDPELKKVLDEDVGPAARQLIYYHILKPENQKYFHELCLHNHGWFWRTCWTLFVGSYVLKLMTKLFAPKTFSPESTREKLDQAFVTVEGYLNRRKGKYLDGDEIGLSDIALASLAAPLLSPPLYYEGKFTHIFNKIFDSDASVRAERDKYRNTAVGQYILEIYAKHRL